MIAQANVTLPELVEDLSLVIAPPAGGLSWWWIAAGIVAILALVVPLYLTFRPRKPAAEEGAAPKPDPAEIALRRLGMLKSSLAGLTQREAAIELAAILRDYVCERFEIRAPYQTTGEFVRHLGPSGLFPADQSQSVADLLNTFDLVKFATVILQDDALQPWIGYVEEFVNRTRQRPDPAADTEAPHG